MKGKMLCVIYCVLSNLTVVLFETAVLWLHPGEGRAQIDAGGGGDGWRCECLLPSHPLPDVERGGSAPEDAHGSQALYPQMFIDLHIQSFKKFIRADPWRLLFSPQHSWPCSPVCGKQLLPCDSGGHTCSHGLAMSNKEGTSIAHVLFQP